MKFDKKEFNTRDLLAKEYDTLKYFIRLGFDDRVRKSVKEIQLIISMLKIDTFNAKISGTEILNTPEGVLLLKKIKDQYRRIEEGRKSFDKWKSRSYENELYKTIEGISAIIDRIIPIDFDLINDIIVLSGKIKTSLVYLINELISRGLKRIFLYCNKDDTRYFNNRMKDNVTIFNSKDELFESLITYGKYPPRQFVIKVLEGSIISKDELKNYVQSGVNLANSQLIMTVNRGDFYTKQTIHNFSEIARYSSIISLESLFENVPCILVGGGPSLDINVELLKSVKGKALIIAIHRSVKTLWKFNIIPDIVIVCDPMDLSMHFEDVPMNKIGAFILGSSVNPNLFKINAPVFFTFDTGLTESIYELFNEDTFLGGAGTVTTVAFNLALFMKCNPIMLVGQDLSFKGDRYYSSSAVNGNKKVVDKKEYFKVPSWDGNEVLTSNLFKAWISWYELTAASYNDGFKLLNCTEGGAYIKGMEHIKLSDAIDKYVKEDVDLEGLLKTASKCKSKQRTKLIKDHLKIILQYIQNTLIIIFTIQKMEIPKSIDKLNKLENTVFELYSKISFIRILNIIELKNAKEEILYSKTIEDKFKCLLKVCNIMQSSITIIKKYYTDSLRRLK